LHIIIPAQPTYKDEGQVLIELALPGSDEGSLLEGIRNHVAARGIAPEKQAELFA